MLTYWSPVQTETTSDSKRNNWSLIPTNFGRHFHAMSARLRPKARLIRITKWASHFQTFQRCYHLYIDILYQRAHELILSWDAKLFHSGSNLGTPWHFKKGLAHVLVGITRILFCANC